MGGRISHMVYVTIKIRERDDHHFIQNNNGKVSSLLIYYEGAVKLCLQFVLELVMQPDQKDCINLN